MHSYLGDYLAELGSRNYSVSRLLHVCHAVRLLMLYLEEAHQISQWHQVRLAHLQGFTVFAAARYRTPEGSLIHVNTLRQWLSCVRVFFAWMRLRGHLTDNPAETLNLPKTRKSMPKILGSKAITRLMEMPDTDMPVGVRDRALMETLYATGIRHCEAYRLNTNDVDVDTGLLMVRQGKGRRDRLVPLTEVSAHWLSIYISAVRPSLLVAKRGGKENQPYSANALWLSNKGQRLSYQMIAERIGVYAARAGVRATVHSFRHSCATHLLRGGASTRYIQKLLGHRSIETTEIYTQVEVKDLRRVMQRAFKRLDKE